MKFFLRILVTLWIRAPLGRRCVWTSEDTQHLGLFLESGCGKRFLLKLREAAADKSFGSVYGASSTAVSAAAYARGFCDSLGLIFALAKSLPRGEASEYEVSEGGREPGMPAVEQGSGFLGGTGVIGRE
jgi:hypothetical protein